MASLNKVMIIGNLGRDPEARQAGSTPVANFSVACSERFKDRSGERQERTEWVNVVAWGRLADVCRDYLRKGSSVYVEGKLQTRSWDDKNTGARRYATEVVAAVILMLDRKPRDDQQGGGYGYGSAPTYGNASAAQASDYYHNEQQSASSAYTSQNDYPPAGDDDLPF